MRNKWLLRFIWLLGIPSTGWAKTEIEVTRIAFGSCAHQDDPQPIWRAVNKHRPDVFVFLGDNIYGDTEDMRELRTKYEKLAAKPGFKQLRAQTSVIAIWDDHDYGENDAGHDYPKKEASRKIMLDFWQEPAQSARRTRDSGIYTSYLFGPPGKRIQIILPDLRWNRTALNSVTAEVYESERKPRNMGPYEPATDPEARLLGEQQWLWLEKQLKQPADIRLIGSSLQLLPEFTGWESWANFPAERRRLLDLIEKHRVEGLFIISGDTHWAEFSRLDNAVGYPLWEATSSGLTEEWKEISPNRHRIGRAFHHHNYGLIEIDWNASEPFMSVSIRDESGGILLQNNLRLSDLH